MELSVAVGSVFLAVFLLFCAEVGLNPPVSLAILVLVNLPLFFTIGSSCLLGWKMIALNSPRILISRLSHIGDCILTLPMLSAIRRKYPEAYICWAVEKPSNQLLESHPGLDEIMLIPKGWMGKPSAWRYVAGELRSRKFDIAIDPQGITKSAMLSFLSGARKRIGIRGKWGRELAPLLNNCNVQQECAHLVDRSLELLEPLGIQKSHVEFGFQVAPSAGKSMRKFLADESISGRFAVINPGASWPSKRWETCRFADVAEHLYECHQLPTVVTWAGDAEHAMAVQLKSLAPSAVTLAPPTSLNELAAILSIADFFIGCDTGPMHISTAVGTPCVGLYGSTLPTESGAYGLTNLHVQKWHQNGSCRQRRKAENLAMRDIVSADVNRACDQMIQRLSEVAKTA